MYPAIVRAERHCVVRGSTSVGGHSGCRLLLLMRWLLPNRVHGLVQDEVARCNSFEIHSAWSVRTALRTVLCKDAHQMHAAVDSGCDENVHQMCEPPNYGRVLVAAEVMELWRRSGDGLALGTHAPLAIERRPHVPVCPSVGGISVNCQREISHDKTSG